MLNSVMQNKILYSCTIQIIPQKGKNFSNSDTENLLFFLTQALSNGGELEKTF